MRGHVSVAKLGGSLLDLPRLAERIRNWRATQPERHIVMMVGGGRIVDVVRDLYRELPWTEEQAHWQCVRLLTITTEIVSSWLPEWPLTDSFDRLKQDIASPGTTFFQVEPFLRSPPAAAQVDPLPATWAVTTDSIAGSLAIAIGADQLTLLKSRLPPSSVASDFAQLAAIGYVDPHFTQISARLPRCVAVDFRSTETGCGPTGRMLGELQAPTVRMQPDEQGA